MSSTDSALEAEAGVDISTSPVEQQDEQAESSTAEGVEKSYIEAVNKVLDKGAEESPASGDGEGKPSPKPDKDAKSSQDEDPSEDEIKRYPPNSQRRIRQLLDQRNEIRMQVEALEGELKPKAEHLDRITGYLEEHGIQPQEFDNVLEITRMMKAGDYEELLPILTPIYLEVAKRAGKVLPPDLQEDVRLGRMPEARARELHENRTRSENLTERQEQDQARREEQAARGELQRRISTAASAGDEWAKAKAASDPDWNLKQDDVAAEVERLILKDPKRYPKTKEETVALSEEALKTVEARIKRFASKPAERRNPISQPPSPRSAAKPKTYMEAVELALSNSG